MDFEGKVDDKLSKVFQKIEGLEVGQNVLNIVSAQMNQVEKTTHNLDTAARLLEDYLKQVEVEASELYNIVETVDNKLCKNNLCLRRLMEGAEGENLKTYMETLLTGCMNSDTEAEIKLSFAHCLDAKRQGRKSN